MNHLNKKGDLIAVQSILAWGIVVRDFDIESPCSHLILCDVDKNALPAEWIKHQIMKLQRLMDPNFPLTLVDWELTSIQRTEDKYDKKLIGKVKNNCKRNLSEVRIEFTVYDEKEAQIAIISQNTYDLKPSCIWNFALLVTNDVVKARLKGLYCVPTKELKGLEDMVEE